MNRKEMILVSALLISTFIGAAHAPPLEQILNVFVTNFPANQSVTVTNFGEERIVLSGTFTIPAGLPGFFDFGGPIIIDVSQYGRAQGVFLWEEPCDNPTLGTGANMANIWPNDIGNFLPIESAGPFNPQYDNTPPHCGGIVVYNDFTLKYPKLQMSFDLLGSPSTDIIVTAEVRVFLQR